jgi:pimeloyl-ACP methyl ester carboxylesterase
MGRQRADPRRRLGCRPMALVFERRGDGEPLLLLHGIGSRWQAFAPVLGTLAERFEVFALDMPGFGASPAPAGGVPSIAALTDEVQAWMVAQGIEGGHVAGNSTGGGVALELAARGVVASATALAPIGFWSRRERVWCQASLRGTRAFSAATRPLAPALAASPASRTLSMAQYYAKPWRLTPQEIVESIDALLGASAFDDVLAAFTGYLAPAGAADRVPVTIAWGAQDRLLLPRQLERARHRIPRARHVLIPGAGHLMMSDQPEAVAAVIAAGARAG